MFQSAEMGADEMAQHVKVLSAKSDALSLILGTERVERETSLPFCFLFHVCFACMYVCVPQAYNAHGDEKRV